MGIWAIVFQIGLSIVSMVFKNKADSEEMQKLWFDHIERMQREYLNSAKAKQYADQRMKKIQSMQFEESP